jgi:tetratricopeptide (TPR) repeat protein
MKKVLLILILILATAQVNAQDTGKSVYWYKLAWSHLDTEEGYIYFKKAIEADPTYPPPYYWLAYQYCRDRRDKEAIPVFEKYLEVAKDDPNESGRCDYAREVLKDLMSGKEGESLSKTRRAGDE